MLIKKITYGFVVQTFTTESEYPVSQEFIGGEQVDYEDKDGEPLDEDDIPWYKGQEPTLNMDMVQPNPRGVDSSEKVSERA